MADCCDQVCSVEATQRGTLLAVLAINGVMFVVIAAAALIADSSALLSDSLDNLGDALTYALSLYAVHRGTRTKAKVALFKAALIFLAACVVAGQIVHRVLVPIGSGVRTNGGLQSHRIDGQWPMPVLAVETPGRGREHELRLGVLTQ